MQLEIFKIFPYLKTLKVCVFVVAKYLCEGDIAVPFFNDLVVIASPSLQLCMVVFK